MGFIEFYWLHCKIDWLRVYDCTLTYKYLIWLRYNQNKKCTLTRTEIERDVFVGFEISLILRTAQHFAASVWHSPSPEVGLIEQLPDRGRRRLGVFLVVRLAPCMRQKAIRQPSRYLLHFTLLLAQRLAISGEQFCAIELKLMKIVVYNRIKIELIYAILPPPLLAHLTMFISIYRIRTRIESHLQSIKSPCYLRQPPFMLDILYWVVLVLAKSINR